MKIRTFHAAGLEVSAIGFGALHLSLPPRPDPAQSIEVIHHAVESGITFIDTADCYCTDESDKHHNEVLVREALRSSPGGRVLVATKGGMRRPQGRWVPCGDPDYLLQTIQRSFQALGSDAPIELWQYHAPDPRIDIRRSLFAAAEAVKRGWVLRVGLSNVTLEHIRQAREIMDVVSVQNKYSLFHRRPEWDGTLDYCEKEGLLFFPWSPFGGKKDHHALKRSAVVNRLANSYNISVYAVALAWLMSRSAHVIPIPGTANPAHLEDWAGACDLKLSETEIHSIECSIYQASDSHCSEDELLLNARS
jgi:aryl-alcohol dehydrogenase-like predicted oxidoreductase